MSFGRWANNRYLYPLIFWGGLLGLVLFCGALATLAEAVGLMD